MSSEKTTKKSTTRKKAATKPKPNSKREASLNKILSTAEKLMLEEGYAAVSTRRVAKDAGLKPSLVHYYFATTDDLFLTLFRRAADRELQKLDEALLAPQSLQNLWTTYRNQNQNALAMEFMALANHRKAIREEIATLTEQTRTRRAEVLSKLIDIEAIKPEACSAAGLTVLLIGVARTLVMENSLGISLGHDEANQFVEWWLQQLEKPS